MDNYNYPEGSDTPDAPWNQPDIPCCIECKSDNIKPDEFGYECLDCGFMLSNEPDWGDK
jgi:hypothetical protein